MATVSLKLPDPLHHELEREAAARGISKSAVIRESLELALRTKGGTKKLSCLDLMRDLVGIYDGPPDASTSKKYLEEAVLEDYERQQRKARH